MRIDFPLFRSLFLLLSVLGAVPLAHAATFTVTKVADTADGTCNADCSLREAIVAANAAADNDTINFAGGVTGTIQLSSALPDLSTPITITGSGSDVLTVSGVGVAFRIFTISNGTEAGPFVTLSGLTITNGAATTGGGINNDHGNLTISNCAIINNSATSTGAGIYNGGGSLGSAHLTISNSTISGNVLGGSGAGGGIANVGFSLGNASATLTNCTISSNGTADVNTGIGGGIYSNGSDSGNANLTLTNCTLNGNMARFGAGVRNYGVTSGGAALTVQNCTFSGNSGTSSASIDNMGDDISTNVTVGNTIFKTGSVGANLVNSGGGITSLGYNLSNDNFGGFLTATGDQINTEPLLNVLADNGGPTQTMSLQSGSPALDQGKKFGVVTGDQRGFLRPIDLTTVSDAVGGDGSDIGAYEENGTIQTNYILSVNNSSDHDDGLCTTLDCTLREAINAANSNGDFNRIGFDLPGAGPHTITLTAALPAITSFLYIYGPTSESVEVNGGSTGPVFTVSVVSTTITFANLTISNGKGQSQTLAQSAGAGGIDVRSGEVFVSRCLIKNNQGGDGLGADVLGSAGNGASGGIQNSGSDLVTLTDCTVANNVGGAGGNGLDDGFAGSPGGTGGPGGIAGAGVNTYRCTVANNTGGIGGTGGNGQNPASSGGQGGSGGSGGIGYSDNIYGTIIANNTGGSGGSGGSGYDENSEVILGANGTTGSPDVAGAFLSLGYNLIGKRDGSSGFTQPGDQTGTIAAPLDPKLNPLSSNGGPTQTMALQTSSAAINAGDPAFSSADPDQRGSGFPRVQGGRVDIGAFESPAFSIDNASITEGDSGTANVTFTVTLSAASTQTVTVNFATADGTAKQPGDYNARTGILTFQPGQISKSLTVGVKGDTLDENNEKFFVDLSNATNAIIDDSHGICTIVDNDPTAALSINDITFNETTGPVTNASFTVTLSATSGRDVTVNYTTADGTAHQPDDYNARSGTLLFTPGQTTKTITVGVKNENVDENNEFFKINLSGASGATIADNQGVCTIVDDDTAAISINDVAIVENDAGPKNMMFTISLSNPSSQTVTVAYATADNTAKAGSDYVATSGTATFSIGQTVKTFIVQSTGDLLDEDNETYFVNLTNPTNATILDGQGVGTTNDNDPSPSLSINDITFTEGNSGTTNATFTVTLSTVSGRNVTVNFATADGTATAGSDYNARSGTVTLLAGQISKTITVGVKGDTLFEANETFKVNLSGAVGANIADTQGVCTIANDDAS